MVAQESETNSAIGFDVGNTGVKCAIRESDGWHFAFRAPARPLEDLQPRLEQMLRSQLHDMSHETPCLLCSVNPPAAERLIAAWRNIEVGGEPHVLRRSDLPISVNVERPQDVGVDRLLAALGARDLTGPPCVAVCAGTAVTTDLVDTDGAFAGGAISPGLHLCAGALHQRTALLPLVSPGPPPDAPGRSTSQALSLGVYWSVAGGVRALIEQYRDASDDDLPVVVSGGDAPLLIPALKRFSPRHEALLVFRGMESLIRRP